MMAKAGATHEVVMARAHPATLRVVVKAGAITGQKSWATTSLARTSRRTRA